MRTVVVVGAGFSGLTLAHELLNRGFGVQVFEKQKRAGGLIGTRVTPDGLVETAANAVLANADLEALFEAIGVELADNLPSRSKRYIYWDGPKRWPLSTGATFQLLKTGIKVMLGREDVLPRKGESVRQWAVRTVGEECEERLIQPALQGIFAGETAQLSAVLTLSSVLQGRGKKGRLKGSVAPAGGMEDLIRRLTASLEERGVLIEYGRNFTFPEYLTDPVALCTSAWSASEITRTHDPKLSATLSQCESLSLVTATAFFEPAERDLEGFGCLFPPTQMFTSLGVLFNDRIFAGRSERMRSETWILGGSTRPDLVTWSDDEIVSAIVKDRERLGGGYETPHSVEITRWPRAIPNYSVAWEKTLRELKAKPPLFLHGNYLGALGLARIHKRSIELADKIQELYG